MTPATKTYTFTLFVQGVDILSHESMDALFEAGCDDATFGARDGAHYGEFDRVATSFSAALASAIHDITDALPGLEIVRVEPDDLVSMATIAERSGRSRESIRLLASKQRGPGGFPPPSPTSTRRPASGTGPTSPTGSPNTPRPRSTSTPWPPTSSPPSTPPTTFASTHDDSPRPRSRSSTRR